MSDALDDPLADPAAGPETSGISWRVKLAIAVMIAFAIGVVLFTNKWLTDRFTETTLSRAELRLALYSGNILTELQRNSIVPLLLARDPELIAALDSGQFRPHVAAPDLVPVRDRRRLDPAAGRRRACRGRDEPQPDRHQPCCAAFLRRGAAVEGHRLCRRTAARWRLWLHLFPRAHFREQGGGRHRRRSRHDEVRARLGRACRTRSR